MKSCLLSKEIIQSLVFFFSLCLLVFGKVVEELKKDGGVVLGVGRRFIYPYIVSKAEGSYHSYFP